MRTRVRLPSPSRSPSRALNATSRAWSRRLSGMWRQTRAGAWVQDDSHQCSGLSYRVVTGSTTVRTSRQPSSKASARPTDVQPCRFRNAFQPSCPSGRNSSTAAYTGSKRGSSAITQVNARIPPGRSKFRHRATVAAGSASRYTTNDASTASKLAGPNDGSEASTFRKTTLVRPSARAACRARVSIGPARSMPVTRPPGATARAAGIETAPAPQPTSRTHMPGASPARAIRRVATGWFQAAPLVSHRGASVEYAPATRAVRSLPVTSRPGDLLDVERAGQLAVAQHQVRVPLDLHRV